MNKTIYFFLFFTFTFFSTQSLRSAVRNHEIKKEGHIEYPIIRDRPMYSSGTASMFVSLNGKEYRLEIGLNFCGRNNCKVGSKVKVIYSSAYDRMILPDKNTKMGFYASAILFLFTLYCLYKSLQK